MGAEGRDTDDTMPAAGGGEGEERGREERWTYCIGGACSPSTVTSFFSHLTPLSLFRGGFGFGSSCPFYVRGREKEYYSNMSICVCVCVCVCVCDISPTKGRVSKIVEIREKETQTIKTDAGQWTKTCVGGRGCPCAVIMCVCVSPPSPSPFCSF